MRVAKVLGIKKNFFAKKIFFEEIKFFLRSFNLTKNVSSNTRNKLERLIQVHAKAIF